MIPLERVIFWVLFAIALGIFSYRIYFLSRLLRLGREERAFNHLRERTKTVLLHVLPQWCSLKTVSSKDLAGIGHLFLFWGFILFLVNYLIYIFIGEGLGISHLIIDTAFSRYFLYILDIAGLFVLFAIVWAAVRRYIMKPERLESTMAAGIILLLIFALIILHFVLGGLRINSGVVTFGGPVAAAFASFFNWIGLSSGFQQGLLTGIWWLHYLIILGFLIYITYSKHLHILVAPFNIFFRSLRPKGALAPVDLEAVESFGASRVDELTWKQLLESYACTECGRCKVSCPAYLTGKPLSPQKLILDIKKHLLDVGPLLLASRNRGSEQSSIPVLIHSSDEILSCTTCGACLSVCPVLNRHVDIIVELRRNLVYNGTFDQGHKRALQRTTDNFNPWGMPWNTRSKNIGVEEVKEGQRYDVLYWVGCAASFDDRAREIARAISKILETAGIKVGILGTREKCCGDFARRIGDEGLFQMLALENIETINRFRFDAILTHCPHCYNTLKNEYHQFGANFEVFHHTEFILSLISNRMIKLDKMKRNIVYHDPCYLGRHNGIYNEPRRILSLISQQIPELPRSFEKSFCCGAGGGHMWKDAETGKRMSNERVEEIIASGAKTVATACPFCLLMFEEALQVKGLGEEIRVKDIAELVEEARI